MASPQNIPGWVSPAPNSPALLGRTFFHPDWYPAIGLMIFGQVFGRCKHGVWAMSSSASLPTSKSCPSPSRPIAAEGATALAESSAQKEGWRWRIFSIGAMIGVGWGTIYILIPSVTGLVFSQPITILSNPFIDLTSNTQKIMPGALSALGTDLGAIFVGFVLPLPVVVGSFIGGVGCHLIANPIMQKQGVLHTWTPGLDVIQTGIVNYFDFWLSFGAGVSIVVAVIGIVSVIRALTKNQRNQAQGVSGMRFAPPPGRGDIPIWVSLLAWAMGTGAFIGLCHYLVPGYPVGFLIFFGFVWNADLLLHQRAHGRHGGQQRFHSLRQRSLRPDGRLSSGEHLVRPIPLSDFGGMASHFRTVELTRTKFVSIVKVELLILPIMACSLLYWSFIWRLAPIPSSVYPYASKFWPATAQQTVIWWTANRSGSDNFLLKVLNPHYIIAGGVIATAAYGITYAAGMPILFFYGLVNGMNGAPAGVIPMFIGGMLGRYYFQSVTASRTGAPTPPS